MNYAKINLFDIANGNGIRVSLFVSGCKFHCLDCFNREAWDYNFGSPYTSKISDIILERLKNPNFEGLSILGGDPFWQSPEDIMELAELCRKVVALGKNVWIWTGFKYEDLLQDKIKFNLLKYCTVLIDGRFEVDKKDLTQAWRGSTNQRVINVQESFKANKVITMNYY